MGYCIKSFPRAWVCNQESACLPVCLLTPVAISQSNPKRKTIQKDNFCGRILVFFQ